ncbi:MAG: hypothetical protein ABIQ70_06465 [Dokdonella sp.]
MRILVKAYPQPSRTYEETVCVAAISEDGREMLRLFPIRYRHLPKDRQFDRFDLVELDMELPRDDHRPESRHVDEASIRIVGRGKDVSDAAKVRLWKPFIAPTLKALHEENKTAKRSFGIVRPDPGSVKFFVKPTKDIDADGRAMNEAAYQQASLFDEPLAKLPPSDYAFGYRFTSGGHPHEHLIHDWEVQAAYIHYRRRYGDDAIDQLKQMYGERIPTHNLHFILGTMKAHPQTFIIIGLLRSPVSPDELDQQPELF